MRIPGSSRTVIGETWIDPEEMAYSSYSGAPSTSERRGKVRCADGKLRTFKLGVSDTFFSVPAVGKINGKYARGFVTGSEAGFEFHQTKP